MLLRTTLIVGPAIVMPRLAAFVIVLVLTHKLPAAEFGLYALVVLVGEILDMTCSSWIRIALLRLDIANPNSWRSGFGRSAALTALSTMVGLILAAAVTSIIAPSRFFSFWIALAVYLASSALLRLGLTTLQMRRQIASYSILEVTRSLLQVAAIVVVITQFGSRLTFWAANLSMSAMTTMVGIAAVYFGLKSMPADTDQSLGYAERFRYGSSLILLSLTTYLVIGTDRFCLQLLAGPAAVGVYSAAYVLGRQPIDILAATVNQGAFPELMKRFDQVGLAAARALIGQTFELFVLLTWSAVTAIWALAPAIADTVLPVAYRETARVIMPLIAITGLLMTTKTTVFDNVFHMYRKNWLQLSSYFPAGVATVLTASFLVPDFGATGAAIASNVGAAFGLLGSVVMTRRLVPVPVDARNLAKTLVVAATAGIGAALVSRGLVNGPGVLRLFSGAVAYATIWALLAFFLQPPAVAGPRRIVMRFLDQRLGVARS